VQDLRALEAAVKHVELTALVLAFEVSEQQANLVAVARQGVGVEQHRGARA
jgi:hypothetical protein